MKLVIAPIRNQVGLEDIISPLVPLSLAVISLRHQQSFGFVALVLAVKKQLSALVYASEPNEGSAYFELVPAFYNRNKQPVYLVLKSWMTGRESA
jgi:hypothetical protein